MGHGHFLNSTREIAPLPYLDPHKAEASFMDYFLTQRKRTKERSAATQTKRKCRQKGELLIVTLQADACPSRIPLTLEKRALTELGVESVSFPSRPRVSHTLPPQGMYIPVTRRRPGSISGCNEEACSIYIVLPDTTVLIRKYP